MITPKGSFVKNESIKEALVRIARQLINMDRSTSIKSSLILIFIILILVDFHSCYFLTITGVSQKFLSN